MKAFVFSFVAPMLLFGFALAQSNKQPGTKIDSQRTFTQGTAVAGLAELPHGAAATLRAVPDSQLLATQTRQLASAPAEGPPHPPCAADESVTFYDAKVTVPITVCSPLVVGNALEPALFSRKVGATRFKLTDPAVFQSLAALKDPGVKATYVCTSSDGPWPARIISERRCSGSSSPFNLLFVVGVPNTVEFGWYGALTSHPAGFEFVGSPVQTDHQSFGQCHAGN